MAGNNHSTSSLLRGMVAAARELKVELVRRRDDPAIVAAGLSLATDLNREVSLDEAADVLAQAVVCTLPLVSRMERRVAVDWLDASLSDWERWAWRFAQGSVPTTVQDHGTAHLYDQFLHRYAPPTRKHHGVFFTPQPIAQFIVRQIDACLRNDFGLPEGLATHSALRFLDPACGTGLFLLAVIDHLHKRLGNDWNDFVPDLLPRLTGIELLPVPAFLAKLNIAQKLAETGYDFRQPGQIQIHLGDALHPALHCAIRNPQSVIPVVLGNPPFSSLTTNTNAWIARLVRGDAEVRGYVQAGEERLAERKTWLHDDYVKFIRLAQWIVEETGAGIVAFVTNHGYLDNVTFRLLRQELLRVFPHIQIVDLHGNRKKGETAPGGGLDENVFGLDQGVAIGLFAKPTRSASEGMPEIPGQWSGCVTRRAASGIQYSELWGTRDAKLRAMASDGQACMVTPAPPHWRFVPTAAPAHPEYAAGWPLDKAMPVNTSAPVTARDSFVVAFTRDELAQRIAEFRDLSISDEVIRERYFNRTRSRRYPPGDTRGWKLSEARRIVAADEDWPAKIVRCLYRPFDWRYVFWHPAMIDWPRAEVTCHLVSNLAEQPAGGGEGENGRVGEVWAESSPPLPLSPSPALCLIARRQQLPTQPCTFFWVSDCLALDGVVRSDNRGSESLFPLWLGGENGSRTANFVPSFVEQFAQQIGRQPAAEDLLAYIYALFHSPTYRERYAHLLRRDFPRVLLPASSAVFDALAVLGQRLIELHLLRGQDGVGRLWRPSSVHNRSSYSAKDSRPPDARSLGDFRIGGYSVQKKWLQPKHRSPDDAQFRHIAAAIEETIAIMAAIDEVAQFHGFMK